MPTPAQPVDIANLSLLQLYQAPIGSLTNTNDNTAIIMNTAYDQVRRSLLRNFVWSFAKMRAYAPLVTQPANPTVPLAPPFDYLNYYQLPVDCLRLLFVGYDFTRFCPLQYDINGRQILLNPTNPPAPTSPNTPWPHLAIIYQTDLQDVTLMDPLFIDCFALQLAEMTCMPITGDADLATRIDAKLKQMLAEANAINHQENPVIVTEVDPIAYAREMTTGDDYQLNINPTAWGNVDAS